MQERCLILRTLIKDMLQMNLSHTAESYWPRFSLAAYALYDDDTVYLFNHPLVQKEVDFVSFPTTKEFMGDTLILYEGVPTPIVHMDRYERFQSLYSMVMHESFHAYQYIQEEHRFPDEVQGMTYPLNGENAQIRQLERMALHDALFERNPEEKRARLRTFFSLREHRRTVVGDFLDYELKIETIEGPAWYVELKAYAHQSACSYESIVKKYSEKLLDKKNSIHRLRGSCYSSGLAICLLLDEFAPSWKETFFNSNQTMYDLLKVAFHYNVPKLPSIPTDTEIESYIAEAHQTRIAEIDSFLKQSGYHILIKGITKIKGFDPMNVVISANRRLHKTFLKVEMNDDIVLFQQPVLVEYADNQSKIVALHLVLDQRPIIHNENTFTLDGIGVIIGIYDDRTHTLTVK